MSSSSAQLIPSSLQLPSTHYLIMDGELSQEVLIRPNNDMVEPMPSPDDDVDEELLINQVRRFRLLYNYTLSSYRDKNKRNIAWQEIANAIGTSVKACELKRRKLRKRFVREKKKKK